MRLGGWTRGCGLALLVGCAQPAPDGDGDGEPSLADGGLDCDDLNPYVGPGQDEIWYDGIDQDCDGADDFDQDGDGVVAGGTSGDCDDTDAAAGAPFEAFWDGDGDGFGVGSAGIVCEDTAQRASQAGDCDDGDAVRFPGNPEVCDGRDNDCDGATEADELDEDADGYRVCEGDCDDLTPAVNPLAWEVCNGGVDDDCDGLADGTDASGQVTWWPDADGDGFGDPAGEFVGCDPALGTDVDAARVPEPDCDPLVPAIYPGAPEVPCDSVDADCDGDAVDLDVVGPLYLDADLDGYGAGPLLVGECPAPDRAPTDDDCDDADADISPAAVEICDGRDNDCDAATDDADVEGVFGTTEYWTDVDGDGYGFPGGSYQACVARTGADVDASAFPEPDCGPGLGSVYPGAPEVACDGLDEDCDGDDEDPDASLVPLFTDTDLDGYGAGAPLLGVCPAVGLADTDVDCDDANAAVNPGVIEIADYFDANCTCDVEMDGDGDGVDDGSACDLLNPSLDRAACGLCTWTTEIENDGLDQDCDGADLVAVDADFDGEPAPPAGADCDDLDGSVGRVVVGDPGIATLDDALVWLAATCPGPTDGVVVLPAGTYTPLGTVALDRAGVRLRGAGADLVLLSGLALGASPLLRIDAPGVRVSGVAFADVAGAAIEVAASSGVAISGVLLEDLVFRDTGSGVVALGGNGLAIRRSVFERASGSAAAVEGPMVPTVPFDDALEVSDCTFEDNVGPAVAWGVGDVALSRVTVSGQLGDSGLAAVSLGGEIAITALVIETFTGVDPLDVVYGDTLVINGLILRDGSYDDAFAARIATSGAGFPAEISGLSVTGVTGAGGPAFQIDAPLARLTDVSIVGNAGVSAGLVLTGDPAVMDHGVLAGNTGDGLVVSAVAALSALTSVGNGGAGVAFTAAGPNTLADALLVGNGTFGVDDGLAGVSVSRTLFFDNVLGDAATGPRAGTHADPAFVTWAPSLDPALWDLHLRAGSPALDLGDPAVLDPDGTRADAGFASGPESLPWYGFDADFDGVPDGFELARGTSPVSFDTACADPDGDGLDLPAEFLLGTWPGLSDTDGDGAADGVDAAPLDSGTS